jgi:sugar phosphate isomerase/epimerase
MERGADDRMKLGFLTACLPKQSLENLVVWAKSIGFEMLEVACWPVKNTRDYSGTTLDVANLTEDQAERIKKLFEQNNMQISSLAYYDNNLHPDLVIRKSYHDHLKKVINAANLLGVKYVGTFVGRNYNKTIKENFDEFEIVFKEILEYAKEKGVSIIIENCPMPGWNPNGGWMGTISYSPELWEEMFSRLPYDNFGLNLDPSHLLWLGIDPVSVIKEFKDKIFHVHAKDTQILKDKLNKYSIFGSQIQRKNEWDMGYWVYRMPGRGEIDWKAFLKELKHNGYDYVVSIEHEDPEYEETEEKVKEGLKLGFEYLKGILNEI